MAVVVVTLDSLVDDVFDDLSDPGRGVFSVDQVEDFVRGGIAELNRVAPIDTAETVALVTDPDTGAITQYEYQTAIRQPYAVELKRISDNYTWPVPQAEMGETVYTGWVFRETPDGGVIEFPVWLFNTVTADGFLLVIKGYADRPIPFNDPGPPPVSPAVPVSDSMLYVVREYAKAQGFDLLNHDRALFAQWQGQTNNTDVSPTQMGQMAAQATSSWERKARLVTVVRRFW